MLRLTICVVIALCIASGANAATLRLKNYLAPENDKQRLINEIYLDGMKDGFIAFNTALARTGAAPLFCLPPDLALSPEQANDIMMQQVKSHPQYPDDMIVSIVLLAALRKTYPCGEQGKPAP